MVFGTGSLKSGWVPEPFRDGHGGLSEGYCKSSVNGPSLREDSDTILCLGLQAATAVLRKALVSIQQGLVSAGLE